MRNSQNNNPVTGAVVSVTNEDGVVAKNVTVNAEGIAVIPVQKNGLYKVEWGTLGPISTKTKRHCDRWSCCERIYYGCDHYFAHAYKSFPCMKNAIKNTINAKKNR